MTTFNGLDLFRFSKTSGCWDNVIFRSPTNQNQSNFDNIMPQLLVSHIITDQYLQVLSEEPKLVIFKYIPADEYGSNKIIDSTMPSLVSRLKTYGLDLSLKRLLHLVH